MLLKNELVASWLNRNDLSNHLTDLSIFCGRGMDCPYVVNFHIPTGVIKGSPIFDNWGRAGNSHGLELVVNMLFSPSNAMKAGAMFTEAKQESNDAIQAILNTPQLMKELKFIIILQSDYSTHFNASGASISNDYQGWHVANGLNGFPDLSNESEILTDSTGTIIFNKIPLVKV